MQMRPFMRRSNRAVPRVYGAVNFIGLNEDKLLCHNENIFDAQSRRNSKQLVNMALKTCSGAG